MYLEKTSVADGSFLPSNVSWNSCYVAEADHFVCRQEEYLEFQKLIYKKSTQNYYLLYSRSKNNVKTARIFPPVPQILVQLESMPVPIIHLFIEIAGRWEPVII